MNKPLFVFSTPLWSLGGEASDAAQVCPLHEQGHACFWWSDDASYKYEYAPWQYAPQHYGYGYASKLHEYG